MVELLTSIVKTALSRLGIFLLLAGMVPLALQAFGAYQSERAEAQVVGIDAYCRLKSCPKCRHRRSTCVTAAANPALSEGLSERKYVRLSYATRDGRQIVAKARTTRLNLVHPQVGDVIPIRYSPRQPTSVRPADGKRLNAIGFIVSGIGVGLLAMRGLLGVFGRLPAAGTPLPSPIDLGKSLRRAHRRKPSETAKTRPKPISPAWGEPGDRPVKAVVALPDNVPTVAKPARRHKTGRNRGLLGWG